MIGGWGVLNREIVSFRSCVCTRGLVAYWNWISKVVGHLFPFPLLVLGGLGELSLFPFGDDELPLFPSSYPHSNFSWAYRYAVWLAPGARKRAATTKTSSGRYIVWQVI